METLQTLVEMRQEVTRWNMEWNMFNDDKTEVGRSLRRHRTSSLSTVLYYVYCTYIKMSRIKNSRYLKIVWRYPTNFVCTVYSSRLESLDDVDVCAIRRYSVTRPLFKFYIIYYSSFSLRKTWQEVPWCNIPIFPTKILYSVQCAQFTLSLYSVQITLSTVRWYGAIRHQTVSFGQITEVRI